MKRNKYLILLLALPFLAYADGQDGLVVILDAFIFIIIFAVWGIVIFPIIKMINEIRIKKLTIINKSVILISTGLIALFIWLMMKSDSQPFDGPIDSIIHRKQNELMKEEVLEYLKQGYKDSTIEETIASVDTSKIGIYIWLNHKSVFVRKNTSKFKTQRQEDSLTMSIVRVWKK